jgi:photosystem II stability/assembly factor-like uncharacterized protein
MKRTWICFLAAASVLILTGCGQSGTAATAATAVQPSPTVRPEPVARSLNAAGAILNVGEFLDEKRGYALGNVAGFAAGATMWTADGGSTWSYQDLILTGCVQFCDAHGLDVVNEDLIWIGTDYSTVYYSTDAGKTWNRVADPGPAATTLLYVSFVDAQTGWVGYPSEVFSTQDGGATWIKLSLPEGVEKVAAINRPTAADGYLLDSAGRLHKTADNGKTWTTQDLGLGKAVLVSSELPNAAMRFPDPRHGVIVLGLVDDGGKVRALRTIDGGATWEQTELPVSMGSFQLSNDGSLLTRVQSFELTIVSLGGI